MKTLAVPAVERFAAGMRDVLFVAMTVGFFGLAHLFVRGCARIVGPDAPPVEAAQSAAQPVPAEVGS